MSFTFALFPNVSILSRSKEEWISILYDDRQMCSKPAPFGYSVSLTTAHLFAAPIYLVAFFTLYAEETKNFKVYKRYLAAHVFSNLLFEFHLSVVMKPVLYLPYPMTRFTGYSVFRYLNGGISLFIFYLFIASTGWSILELFHYRFKLILKSMMVSSWVKKWSIVIGITRVLLILLTMTSVGFLCLCVVGLFDQMDHKIKLNVLDKYPEIQCTSAIVLPNKDRAGIKPIHVFNLSVLISVFVGSFLCGSTGIVSLMALSEMVRNTNTSMRTISMHKSFIISLFFQIGVHGCMLGFPILLYIVSLAFRVNANDVGYVAIVLASLHGAMSTLAMVLFNRPLYELAKTKLLLIFNNYTVRDSSLIRSMISHSQSQ